MSRAHESPAPVPVRPTPRAPARRRVAGVTIPLFSIRTARSWGIGEIGDLPVFAQWMKEAGIRLLQILPLGEISGGETSPYAALSAFGIDPMYISLADVADLGSDVQEALERARLHRPEARDQGDAGYGLLSRARASQGVDYAAVRALKHHALEAAFARFYEHEHLSGSPRAAALRAFARENEAWLPDYALFRALKDAHEGVAWWEWSQALRDRKPRALAEARVKLAKETLYYEYVQWIAHVEWYDARARLRAMGVEIMGDLPFMVGRDSADVWANQGEFRDDAGVGVPPDAFNEEGQDWGLPPYFWEVMRANDFAWLRRRARYTGSLYDRFRIDHLVGFFRTYMRENDKRVDANGKLAPGFFDPEGAEVQRAHGERVVSAMKEAGRETGAELVAEDLGVIPSYVRPTLAKLEVPGYKVLIWEKEGDKFHDPAEYAPISVACFGTHDTDPVAVWWETRDEAERKAILAMPGLAEREAELGEKFTPAVHRALLDLLNGSGSDLVLFLIQDLLGGKERINTPATMGPHNWSYRLPKTVEEMRQDPGIFKLTEVVRKSVEKGGRA